MERCILFKAEISKDFWGSQREHIYVRRQTKKKKKQKSQGKITSILYLGKLVLDLSAVVAFRHTLLLLTVCVPKKTLIDKLTHCILSKKHVKLTKATKLIKIVLQVIFTKPNGLIFLLHSASYLYHCRASCKSSLIQEPSVGSQNNSGWKKPEEISSL